MTVTKYLFYFDIEYFVAVVFYEYMFKYFVRSTACCNNGKLQFFDFL